MLASAEFDAMTMAGLALEAAALCLRGDSVARSIMLPAMLVDRCKL